MLTHNNSLTPTRAWTKSAQCLPGELVKLQLCSHRTVLHTFLLYSVREFGLFITTCDTWIRYKRRKVKRTGLSHLVWQFHFFLLHLAQDLPSKNKYFKEQCSRQRWPGKKVGTSSNSSCNSKTTLSNVMRTGITWNICKKTKQNKNKTKSCICESKLTYFKSHVQDFRFVMVTFHIRGEMNEPKTVTVS